MDDQDGRTDDDDLPALDGYARFLGDARAADRGAVGASEVFHLDRTASVERDVLA